MAIDYSPHFKGTVIGLDVHQAKVTACALIPVPDQEDLVNSINLEFPAFTSDLISMAQWCHSLNPDVVLMESAGVYWKSPYNALYEVGITPYAVNAQRIKKVPGRKTDTSDSQWLAIVGRGGYVKKSFVPTPEFAQIRSVSRELQNLTRDLAARKNRIDKQLSNIGIRLSVAVSDIHGATAKRIIECLVNGGTPQQALEQAQIKRLKASPKELLLALDAKLTPENRFLLKRGLAGIKSVEAEIRTLFEELVRLLTPYQKELDLLQTIPGMSLKGAAMLLAEIGADMSAFGSSERLASWAGICPGNNESAGKKKSGRTRKGNRYIRRVPCEVANAAVRTKSMLKAKYQSLVVRRGRKRAIVAVAHKIIRIVYAILKKGEPYNDSTVDYEKLSVDRNSPRWLRMLEKYGYVTDPFQAGQSVNAPSPKRGRPRKDSATPKGGQSEKSSSSDVGRPENEAPKLKRGRPKKIS
jgi:transposase